MHYICGPQKTLKSFFCHDIFLAFEIIEKDILFIVNDLYNFTISGKKHLKKILFLVKKKAEFLVADAP